jgi:hypothetical protein
MFSESSCLLKQNFIQNEKDWIIGQAYIYPRII